MIREWIKTRPKIAGIVAGMMIVLAMGLSLKNLGAGTQQPGPISQFVTSDHGKTFRVADMSLVPPATEGGAEVVRAMVFQCDQGEGTFVGYLMKYDSAAAARLGQAGGDPMKLNDLLVSVKPQEILIRPPGDSGEWVAGNSPQASTIKRVLCKHGRPAAAVLPTD